MGDFNGGSLFTFGPFSAVPENPVVGSLEVPFLQLLEAHQ